MSERNACILLSCGDSRNGGFVKATKKHFGWGRNSLVKNITVAGGAHSQRVNYDFLLGEITDYTAVLLGKGISNIIIMISDHFDCGYCKLKGAKNIVDFWSNPEFVKRVGEISPNITSIHISTFSYHDHTQLVIPSAEVNLTRIHSIEFEKLAA